MSQGHNRNLFIHQVTITPYICTICLDVFNDPTSIGCNGDHVFCRICLESYFGVGNQLKPCPNCNNGAFRKSNLTAIGFINRVINGLKVKCSLQLKDDEEKAGTGECNWNGELSSLQYHIDNHCSLTLIKCEYCQHRIKRFKLKDHLKVCKKYCDFKCTLNTADIFKQIALLCSDRNAILVIHSDHISFQNMHSDQSHRVCLTLLKFKKSLFTKWKYSGDIYLGINFESLNKILHCINTTDSLTIHIPKNEKNHINIHFDSYHKKRCGQFKVKLTIENQTLVAQKIMHVAERLYITELKLLSTEYCQILDHLTAIVGIDADVTFDVY